MAAGAGKPCLVEKPMAMAHGECVRMNEAFRAAGVPLFVAYYRRALPRFLEVRRLLDAGAIGPVTGHASLRWSGATDATASHGPPGPVRESATSNAVTREVAAALQRSVSRVPM